MTKVTPNLEAFSDRADLVFVIDRFNAIEESITYILTRAIGAPKEREHFVRDILFNNAIVQFSSKVKLFMHLRATNNWPKAEASDFHRLMHIRNQFAHCNRKRHFRITLDKDKSAPRQVDAKLMLESVSNTGQIVAVDVADALQEFTEIYDRLQNYLLKIHKLA